MKVSPSPIKNKMTLAKNKRIQNHEPDNWTMATQTKFLRELENCLRQRNILNMSALQKI